MFYALFILFLLYPFVIKKLWDENLSIEENVKKLKIKLVIWFGILVVILILLVTLFCLSP